MLTFTYLVEYVMVVCYKCINDVYITKYGNTIETKYW